VLMLDEVDKLGRDFRGDPASALLEILDPEQNKSFRDNYLDLPSTSPRCLVPDQPQPGTKVRNIRPHAWIPFPRPLLDRMEMLRLAGYSEERRSKSPSAILIPAASSSRPA